MKSLDISSLNKQQMAHLKGLTTPKAKKEYIEQFLTSPRHLAIETYFGYNKYFDIDNSMQEAFKNKYAEGYHAKQ